MVRLGSAREESSRSSAFSVPLVMARVNAVKLGHFAYLGAAVVAVPGLLISLLRIILRVKTQSSAGRAGRPTSGPWVDAKIERLVIRAESPLVGQHGDGIARHGMGAQERQVGLAHVGRKTAVGIRPVFAQGERKARHEIPKVPPRLASGLHRRDRCRCFPFEICWQGGTPAERVPAEGGSMAVTRMMPW